MKNFRIILFAFVLGFTGLTTVACNDNASENTEEAMSKEYTSAYVCPMHCEGSGSDEMGTCPVCGMDYVVNSEHKSDGHSH